jgi:hypothetical protein
MRVVLILALVASALTQSPPPPASTTPALSALHRATAERNARHDNTRYVSFLKKYNKSYFGVGFDWQFFKALVMA